MKLKVGIAGYGIVGERRRQNIDNNAHMETVAVCDQNFILIPISTNFNTVRINYEVITKMI